MRIEICGGIAAGKTTLASVLATHGYQAVYEGFEGNPFWKAFFTDPNRFAFETELTFLLMHYHQLKFSVDGQVVCDYCFIQDASYADLDLTGRKKYVFGEAYAVVMKELGPPDLIVHLVCDPEIELHRIKARDRSEEASVSVAFLQSLDSSLISRLKTLEKGIRILTIDSSTFNFAKSTEDKREVFKLVSLATSDCI